MIYLTWYLVPGICVLVAFYAWEWLSNEASSPSVWDIVAALKRDQMPPFRRVIAKASRFIFALVTFLVVWPLFVVALIFSHFEEKRRSVIESVPLLIPEGFTDGKCTPIADDSFKELQENEFFVSMNDLGQRMSQEEIEQKEIVADPLGAVPHVPFGHLYSIWERFTSELCDADELWTFSTTWRSIFGDGRVKSGYAVMRGGSIGPHTIVRSKPLESDSHFAQP